MFMYLYLCAFITLKGLLHFSTMNSSEIAVCSYLFLYFVFMRMIYYLWMCMDGPGCVDICGYMCVYACVCVSLYMYLYIYIYMHGCAGGVLGSPPFY